MRYFDHDTGAHKDELIQALRLVGGGEAVDAYWTVIELIYQNETNLVLGRNLAETKTVTHWLCIDWETLKKHIETMSEVGLVNVVFDEENDEVTVESERASETINRYRQKVETAVENGKKGGRPKGSKNQRKTNRKPSSKPNHNQEKSDSKATRVLSLYTNTGNSESKGEGVQGEGKARRFAPPSVQQVSEYAESKGHPRFDAERFVDFYASKGWMVGKNKMKDWKAAVRNWARSEGEGARDAASYSEYDR